MLEREVDLCRERLDNFEDLDLDDLGQFEKMSTAWSKIYLEARVKWLEDSIDHLKDMSS
jgi:hypothetical protein